MPQQAARYTPGRRSVPRGGRHRRDHSLHRGAGRLAGETPPPRSRWPAAPAPGHPPPPAGRARRGGSATSIFWIPSPAARAAISACSGDHVDGCDAVRRTRMPSRCGRCGSGGPLGLFRRSVDLRRSCLVWPSAITNSRRRGCDRSPTSRRGDDQSANATRSAATMEEAYSGSTVALNNWSNHVPSPTLVASTLGMSPVNEIFQSRATCSAAR